MQNNFLTGYFARELQAEYTAAKKCLENISETVYQFKPHPKSMEMGYLALLVAEIPLWIVHIVKEGVVDLRPTSNSNYQPVKHYCNTLRKALKMLCKRWNKRTMIN